MKTKVKALRTEANMTQQQLASLVHVSSRTIISIEKEQYSPSLMLAYRIAQIFGVTVEELNEMEFGTTPLIIVDAYEDAKNTSFFKVLSKLL